MINKLTKIYMSAVIVCGLAALATVTYFYIFDNTCNYCRNANNNNW
jgi:hypothetical protein